MRFFVGVTDDEWYRLHASKPIIDEVNFWKPSPEVPFRALETGAPFLFKLHAPRNFIAGGGFFTKFLTLPIGMAWEAFGEGNGARTLPELKRLIAKRRNVAIGLYENPDIGCIILDEPFFFSQDEWIPLPPDFALNIVTGKAYDSDAGHGAGLWREVVARLECRRAVKIGESPAIAAMVEGARYGAQRLVMPRLGQGSFRVLITDAYGRRCAMTNERTLPALEAAHIRPYSDDGPHHLSNGLLLRRDLHALFDQGYVTVDPGDHRIVVSKRIREEFENGHEYYELHGRLLAQPADPRAAPARDFLEYHANCIFR